MELTITRRDLTSYTVRIKKGELSQKLLNEDVVSLSVTSPTPISFMLGDTISVFGSRYILNRLPKVRKEGIYTYDLEFEGEMYALRRAQFLLYDDTGVAIEGEFSYMGNMEDVARLAITNLNRVYGNGTYVLGSFPNTEVRNHVISSENVLAVLQRICSDYGYEFELIYSGGVTTLNIGSVGSVKLIALKYGAGKGLYQLERQLVDDANIFTRLFAYGSTRNLKSTYRNFSKRLKLPNNDQSFIQDNDAINNLGVIEATKIFDDIYPRRIGVITSVSGINSFIDTTMDFDLNATDGQGQSLYLIPGNSPKVHFNTGNLAGYEFEITSYNHSTKSFTLKYYQDERGMRLPSNDAAYALTVGDEYVLLDIIMPQSYVDAAEAELQSKAAELLSQGKSPKAKYACAIDPIYAKQNELTLKPGDYIPLQDDELGINRDFRVLSVKRDMIEPYRWSIELGDEVTVSLATYLVENTIAHEKIININQLKDPARYRQNWRTTMELQQMVFDQDGYFDSGNIRPLSINTAMLSVGSKAGQFVLNGVVFQPGYNGESNRIVNTLGTLSHYAIEDNIRTWYIEAYDYTVPDNEARYIYIKCDVNGNSAQVKYRTDQLKVDAESGYYYFLIGVLHSVQDGYRKISLTYGATTINGKEIKTGRITSQDGQTYFDLDAGEIKGKIVFRSGLDDSQIEQEIDTAQSTANNAQTAADNAQTTANTALTNANNALTQIGDIVSDNKFTPDEKHYIRREWEVISSEKPVNDAQADTFGITTEKATYGTKFQNLANYLNNGTTWSSGIPVWVNDSNLNTTTIIDGATFRIKFKEYYDARTALLNAIAAKAKTLADTAQSTADTAQSTANTAQTAADNAQTTANTALTNANNALTQIGDIVSDNKFTPDEKHYIRREWEVISSEKPVNDAQADTFGITTEKATYGTKFQNLANYLNNGTTWSSGIPVWVNDSNLNTTTIIDGATFRIKFKEYYDARTALLNAIAAKAKTLADTAQSTANSALSTANNAATQAAAIAPDDSSLKLRYRFDGDSLSVAADESGNRVNGTIQGTKGTNWDWDLGKKGKGFKTISDAGGITVAGTSETTKRGYFKNQAFTISGWFKILVKPSGANYYAVAFDFPYYNTHTSPYYCSHLEVGYDYVNDKVFIRFQYNLSGTAKNITYTANWSDIGLNWHHIAIVYASGQQKLYLDGVLVASDTQSGTITYTDNGIIRVASGNSGYNKMANWVLDELRYDARTLTDAEILGLYKGLGDASSKTTIDGGVITTGNIILKGSDNNEKAGITAEGGETSVRIWAGETYANRAGAPFRALQDGTVYATKGFIGGWSLQDDNGGTKLFKSGTNKFYIDADNQMIAVKDSSNNDKLLFQAQNLPLLSALQATSANNNFTTSNTSFTGTNTLTVTMTPTVTPSYDGNMTVRAYVQYTANENALRVHFDISLTAKLYDSAGSTFIKTLGSASISFADTGNQLLTITGSLPSGAGGVTYQVKFDIVATDDSIIDPEFNQTSAPGTCVIDWSNPNSQYSYTFTYSRALTIIATNGIASYWASNKYFYLSSSDGSYFLQFKGNAILYAPSGNAYYQLTDSNVRMQYSSTRYFEITASQITLKGIPSGSDVSGDWGYVKVQPSTGKIYYKTS